MKDISQIFKSDIKIEDVKQENGIFCCMNDHFVSGDNQKYNENVRLDVFLFMILEKNG